jgi:dihydropyrimidinase
MCTPPVRTDADREALWNALAQGDLDAVSTDHCPFTTADRRRGAAPDVQAWRDFSQVPGGLPGVETRLALIYQGVRDGRLSPERWVELTTTRPARLFGLGDRKGALEPGMDADIVVFDPGTTKRLDAGSLHMRTDHSPYASTTVTGWPSVTISRGTVVARGGEPADLEPGGGRYLRRRPRRP